MSTFKSFGLLTGLGLLAMAPQAQAAEFDGAYDLRHEVLGGDTEACFTIQGDETCLFLALDVRLYEGDFTEESAASIAEDSIGAFEEASGRDLKPKVEQALYEASLMAYYEMEAQLNAGIDEIPTSMSVFQLPWDLSTLAVEMRSQDGASYSAFGKMDLESGAYVIDGIFAAAEGVIGRSEGNSGYGTLTLPLSVEAGIDSVSVSISGKVYTDFKSQRHVDEEPPTDEPPTTDPPTDEPSTDGPSTNEPPADPNTRVLHGVPDLRPTL